jgi:hypothetical protein
MLKEEKLANLSKQPNRLANRPRPGDILIRARESILNQLAGVRPSLVINGGLPEVSMAMPNDLAARLKQALDELKISVMDETGSKVDYRALKNSAAYTAYREECLAVLRHFKPDNLPGPGARLAFWVNLYNALVLDAIITFGVERSVTEGRLGVLAFFRRAAYLVDGQRVSLEDIEHGILRANRGNPFVPGAHFPTQDPRLAWSMPIDPRLHFALNCGGRSCPPIRSYSAEKLDGQLDLATSGFIDSSVEIHPEKNEIALSRIFQWYAGDFGGRDGVIDFLIRYLPEDERRSFIIDSRSELRLVYDDYDWRLNSA